MGIVAVGKLGAAALLHEVGTGAFEAVGHLASRKLVEQLADGFDGLGREGAAHGKLGDEGGALVGQVNGSGGGEELARLHASATMRVEPLASWQASRKSKRALRFSASSGSRLPPWRKLSKSRRLSVWCRLAGTGSRSQNSASGCTSSGALAEVRVVFIGFVVR